MESYDDLFRQSLLQESWESRARDAPATQYTLGAMQEVAARYTEISIETAKRIENQLSNRLNNKGINAEFRLQGSVPLNIHIKGVSDVDLLTIDQQMLMYDQSGCRASSYSETSKSALDVLRRLRNVSALELDMAFPAAKVDTSGAKSIKITGGSLARDVDVVPAIWWDTAEYQLSGESYKRGVSIFNSRENEQIYNHPFLHIERIVQRCDRTSGGLRKSIRLLKNLRADMESEGNSINLNSFDITSIMYHADMRTLGLGQIYELAILYETQRWLDYLYYNFEEAKLLDVPDLTRKIFDSNDKKDGLRLLSHQVDLLTNSVAEEIRSTNFSYGQDSSTANLFKSFRID